MTGFQMAVKTVRQGLESSPFGGFHTHPMPLSNSHMAIPRSSFPSTPSGLSWESPCLHLEPLVFCLNSKLLFLSVSHMEVLPRQRMQLNGKTWVWLVRGPGLHTKQDGSHCFQVRGQRWPSFTSYRRQSATGLTSMTSCRSSMYRSSV